MFIAGSQQALKAIATFARVATLANDAIKRNFHNFN
jgi:hypothetical protein